MAGAACPWYRFLPLLPCFSLSSSLSFSLPLILPLSPSRPSSNPSRRPASPIAAAAVEMTGANHRATPAAASYPHW
uniref:Secreted protein n=1 Tax=Oryza glaberrima TaxID=4538 RepID=I1NNY4_ORYGL